MTTPATPWPPEYAIARLYLEQKRTLESNRSHKRSQDFQRAAGATAIIADLSYRMGMTPTSTDLPVAAMDVVREMPIEGGTDWLHAAACWVAERIKEKQSS